MASNDYLFNYDDYEGANDLHQDVERGERLIPHRLIERATISGICGRVHPATERFVLGLDFAVSQDHCVLANVAQLNRRTSLQPGLILQTLITFPTGSHWKDVAEAVAVYLDGLFLEAEGRCDVVLSVDANGPGHLMPEAIRERSKYADGHPFYTGRTKPGEKSQHGFGTASLHVVPTVWTGAGPIQASEHVLRPNKAHVLDVLKRSLEDGCLGWADELIGKRDLITDIQRIIRDTEVGDYPSFSTRGRDHFSAFAMASYLGHKFRVAERNLELEGLEEGAAREAVTAFVLFGTYPAHRSGVNGSAPTQSESVWPQRVTSSYPADLEDVPTCVDLFCGAGGLSLGFCQAGGRPVAAVDSDAVAIETYKRMFPICEEVYEGDIHEWEPSVAAGSVDVVVGGPPCQGFSLARGLRFVDDPRNHLYKEFVRLVDLLQPKWIVMENVRGITNIGKGAILQQIYEDFKAVGYWLDSRVINMAHYGVPQARERAIIIGSRVSTRFRWPKPTHSYSSRRSSQQLFDGLEPVVSVEQALDDLPWPMGNYFSHRANSKMRGPRNRYAEVDPAYTLRVRGDEFALCEEPATGAFVPNPLPEVEFVYRPVTNSYQAYMRETPPGWIEEHSVAPEVELPAPRLEGTRRISAREQARLQSFPDWFQFEGSPYRQGRQIGNAVPPLFAKQLFEAILSQLE